MIRIILLILIFSSSCDEPAIEGCTSPSACNWDPKATKSDGSCIQPQFCDNWCPENSEDTPPEAGEFYKWNDEGRDCEGICRGNALVDECGICISSHGENNNTPPIESPLWNTSCMDCDGVPNGSSAPDCNGDCGGVAVVDECGICNGDGYLDICSGTDECTNMDCNGDCVEGTNRALINDCDVCTGGDTGYDLNFLKDECGICNGDGYANGPANDGLNACIGNNDCTNMDCAGVCNPNIETSSYLDHTESQFCEQQHPNLNYGWKPFPGCTDLESESNACLSLGGDCYVYGAELDNCLECSGGNSDNTACSADCSESEDECNGVWSGAQCWGGTAELDDCNTCNGTTFFGDEAGDICNCDGDTLDVCLSCDGLGAIFECGCSDIQEGKCDCDGNVENECGVCGGDPLPPDLDCDGNCSATGSNLDENGLDCADECGGDAEEDECGICNGDGYLENCFETEDCTNMNCSGICIGEPGFSIGFDCDGVCGGSASYDVCTGVCCGVTTGIDCGYEDQCGTCDNDDSNDCVADCSESAEECDGIWSDNQCWGGTAELDSCLECSGGNTGNDPNTGGNPDGYSCSDISLLVSEGICKNPENCNQSTFDNLSCPNPQLTWKDGPNGYKILDVFDFGGCFISSVPDYVSIFSITELKFNDNTLTEFPESIVDMESLAKVDLSYNSIETVPSSACNLTNNSCENNETPGVCILDLRGNFQLDCNTLPNCGIITDCD